MRTIISVLFIICSFSLFAQKITVNGVVRGEEGERIAGAIVKIKGEEAVGATDDEGKYAIDVKPDGTLIFESIGYSTQTIDVKGKRTINVKLKGSAIHIDEVEIVAKVKDKIIPEPTDIEVRGGYLHVKTKWRIPTELWNSHVRLIVQPAIVNVTKSKVDYLQGVVYDGRGFNLNQRRMYGFDLTKDPLYGLLEIKEISKDNETVYYRDSIKLENVRDDYRCDVQMLLETYNKILYTDSSSIASGTVNPLRFLDYHALGQMAQLEDKYLPKPEPLAREDKGVVDIQFQVAKTDIDPAIGNNQEELNKIISKLKSVEENELFELQTFYIKGYASPEGVFAKNKQLAEDRTKSALAYIKANISQSEIGKILFEYDSEVQSWEMVAEIMKSDSASCLNDFEKAIKANLNMDVQSKKIAALPFYRNTIVPDYLPKLRKVEYQFTYSQLRELTDDEVIKQYNEEYSLMTKHELWRYYKMNKSEAGEVLNKARKVYPRDIAFANEYASLLLKKGEPNTKILAPFINTETPEAVLINQIAAYFQLNELHKAQEVAKYLPASSVQMRAVLDALNGDYEKAYEVFKEKNDRNKAVILLAMKKNQEALDVLLSQEEMSPETFYLMAIAYNRLNKVNEALIYLMQAFEGNASLEEIAKVDGDLKDLL